MMAQTFSQDRSIVFITWHVSSVCTSCWE